MTTAIKFRETRIPGMSAVDHHEIYLNKSKVAVITNDKESYRKVEVLREYITQCIDMGAWKNSWH